MFKQLFNTKVLGTLILAISMVLAVSNVNELQAQLQDDEIQSPELSPSELAQFESEYEQLVQEINDNSNYTETEKAIRLKFYDLVKEKVTSGYGVEGSIESAIQPTRKFADNHREGNQINFIGLVQEAKQRFL